MPDSPSAQRRVRHHTNDAKLDAIKAAKVIGPGRTSLIMGRPCIHVELEPFGPTAPQVPWPHRRHAPKNDLGIQADGAFIEFDLPTNVPLLLTTGGMLGVRNTGELVTDEPLSLEGLNPVFVKVRWYFWQLWRTQAE